jgi:vacuolar-type H+-ATPase subunit H
MESNATNPLEAVRKKETELETKLQEVRQQVQARVEQAKREAETWQLQVRQEIISLEKDAQERLSAEISQLKEAATVSMEQQRKAIAREAESHLEQTIQFVITEVLPKLP